MTKETVKEQINCAISSYRSFAINNKNLKGVFPEDVLVMAMVLALPCDNNDLKSFADFIISNLSLFFVPNTTNQASPESSSVKLATYWDSDVMDMSCKLYMYVLYRIEYFSNTANNVEMDKWKCLLSVSYLGKLRLLTSGKDENENNYFSDSKEAIYKRISRANEVFAEYFKNCSRICIADYFDITEISDMKKKVERIIKSMSFAIELSKEDNDNLYKYLLSGISLLDSFGGL